MIVGGAKGTRTPDPLPARQVLYQLSYGPETIANASALNPTHPRCPEGSRRPGGSEGRASVFAMFPPAQTRAILGDVAAAVDVGREEGDCLEHRVGRVVVLVALVAAALAAATVVVLTGDSALLPVTALAVGLLGMVAASGRTWWLATLPAVAASGLAVASSNQPSMVAYGVWFGVLSVAVVASFWAFRSRQRARALVAYLDARARHQSIHDELTGLLNLRGAELVGGGLLELARRDGDALFAAIICVEDDGLTMTGQQREDALLTVTEAASAVFRGSDVLARVSTDCLLVVAKGSGLGMELVASRMVVALAELGEGAGPTPTVTVGGALFPPWEEGKLSDLIELARRDLVMQWSLRQQQVARAQQIIEVDPKRGRTSAADPANPAVPPTAGPGSEDFPGDIRF